MTKPKLCQWEGCDEEAANFPNSTIKKKYCTEHAIKAVLEQKRAEISKDKEELEKARENSKKGNATSKRLALSAADKWFSHYIRFKYAFDRNGEWWCECYTCRSHFKMKECDNGHWQKRENKATRFHEDNARPQCTECNQHHKGEFAKFEERLIEDIGLEKVNELKHLAKSIGEDSEIFYREQSDKYRELLNKELKRRGVKNPWKN